MAENSTVSKTKIELGGGSIMLGLIVLGWFIYAGIGRFADRDRSVVVKGLSEREVVADQVIWPLAYRLAGNDLRSLYNEIERSNTVIVDFLTSNGIPQDEITVSPASVTDLQAERYGYNNEDPNRYKAVSVVTVASDKIDLVRSLMSRQGDLLKKGVAIAGDDYQFQTVFSFNGLNDIKPEMGRKWSPRPLRTQGPQPRSSPRTPKAGSARSARPLRASSRFRTGIRIHPISK